MNRFGALLLGAALLSGCNDVTEGQWKTATTVFHGSPALKKQVIADCIVRVGSGPLDKKKAAAALMNVSVNRFPSAFCNRFMNAWASGRPTYQDFRNINSDTADNSRFMRILQGG
ncbi:hypothetical protein ACFSOZ_29390 [Mesorhizobium newzealandense]|uniref:Lipoprotein n=1 Tax=Mesorhizobium newzealandense TaxID=1300302 RepID=A0ABW4UK38_9HYPH